jgi:hypothetical protein
LMVGIFEVENKTYLGNKGAAFFRRNPKRTKVKMPKSN